MIESFICIGFQRAYAMEISEIMFDPPGSDAGREWIEVYNNPNTGTEAITIDHLFIREADVRHRVVLPKGFSDLPKTIPIGSYAVIADNTEKLRMDYPEYKGLLFESSFSLKNEGETLEVFVDDIQKSQIEWNASIGKEVAQRISDSSKTLDIVNKTPSPYSFQKKGDEWVVGKSSPGGPVIEEINPPAVSDSRVVVDGFTSAPLAIVPTPNTTILQSLTSQGAVVSKSIPNEPQIFSNILEYPGTNNPAFAGVQVLFSGNALGLKKEPIENARFIWNLGDGTTKEGKSIIHIYNAPGTYVIFLEVASGEWSATSRVIVVVVPIKMMLTRQVSKGQYPSDQQMYSSCRLINETMHTVDMSGFIIRHAATQVIAFTFPRGSLIAPKASIALSESACTGDLRAANDTVVAPLQIEIVDSPINKHKQGDIDLVSSTKTVLAPGGTLPPAKPTPIISAVKSVDVAKARGNNLKPKENHTTDVGEGVRVLASVNNALASHKKTSQNTQKALWTFIGLSGVAAIVLYWKKAAFGI